MITQNKEYTDVKYYDSFVFNKNTFYNVNSIMYLFYWKKYDDQTCKLWCLSVYGITATCYQILTQILTLKNLLYVYEHEIYFTFI